MYHFRQQYKGKINTIIESIIKFFEQNNTDGKYRFLADSLDIFPGLQAEAINLLNCATATMAAVQKKY